MEKFRKFVEEKSDRSSEEMAQDWGDISLRSIRRYLRLIVFTNKKKHLDTKIAAIKIGVTFKRK
ncbi:MAG: hypothetical protein AB8C84_07440 [Oligoflexales bacterium]